MSTTATLPYGAILVNGSPYLERVQLFTAKRTISAQFQSLPRQRLTLPGVATFSLKGLSRVTLSNPLSGISDFPFLFRLSTTAGATPGYTGPRGIFDDFALSTTCFGSGQFPFPLIPPVLVDASGSLIYDIQDYGLGIDDINDYPYDIWLTFHGHYLIPL